MAASGTVIDSLIVTLGLDPTDFEKGTKTAASTWLKARDDSKKNSKDLVDNNKKAADSFNEVTKSALALFGVLVGAKDLGGFVANVIATDTAVGRLAGNLGLSAKNLQAWQAAAQRSGGSAERMSANAATASGQMTDLRVNGKMLPPGVIRLLKSAGITPQANWTTQDYMLALASAAHTDAMPGNLGQQTTSTLLQQSGFTPDFINLALAHGGSGMQSYLSTMPTVSGDSIKNMQQTQSEWAAIQQTFSQVAGTLVGDLGPAMKPFLDDLLHFGEYLKSAEPFLKLVADDLAIITQNPVARTALEAAGIAGAGVGTVGMLKWAGRFFGIGGKAAVADAGESAVAGAAAAAGTGAAATAAGVLGGAAAIWLGSAGPAGAGEGDVFRKYIQQHAAGNNGSKGYWTPAVQSYVYNRLRNEAGLSDAGARALLSRWMNVEAPGGPTSVNPTSGAQGIGQWLGSRLPGIAGDTSLKDQVSYAIKELTGSESAAGNALRSASTDAQGAIAASQYERAEGWNGVSDNWVGKTLAGMSSIGSLGASAHSALHVHHAGSAMNSFHVGSLVVQTQSRDPEGMAKAAHGALARAAKARPANYGQI